MIFAGEGVLRGLKQRLHQSVYYMAETCYVIWKFGFWFFCDRAVRG